ncbi:SAM hydrolase/SAM-dependent halogenase family protein [Methylolobus aquaticus]
MRPASPPRMIFLFTDFGDEGPYLGQMESVLLQHGNRDIVRLMNDAPRFDPAAAAFLLAALVPFTPPSSVILGVVDPGVGGERSPVALEADGRWFVGPDNGLFNTAAARCRQPAWFRIDWRPGLLTPTFHGRDLFAPIAARIAQRDFTWAHTPYAGPDLTAWPDEFDRVIYFDAYGNAMTGRRYLPTFGGRRLRVGSHWLEEARTFSAVEAGTAFWYCNSIGLIEIAVNRGSARAVLDLSLGMAVVLA